jgi:hypothetical protein
VAANVEVTGHLELSLDDERFIDVTAHGSRIRAEIGTLGPKRPGLRFIGSSALLARRLSRVLNARKLTLAITREGETVAEIGAGVPGNPIAKLLGFGRVRVFGKKK